MTETRLIPLAEIDRDPTQPRQVFEPAALQELAASIAENGLQQPITVRPLGGRFQIVMGERRYRAHQLLGLSSILCHVRQMGDVEKAVAAIVENMSREDISPLEEAAAFGRLRDVHGLDVGEIAKRLGVVPFRVEWRLKLLNLEPTVRRLLETDQLDRQQALEIARLPDHADQIKLLRMVNAGKLIGWKAVRNAVEAILNPAGEAFDLFGAGAPKATAADVAMLSAMERKVQSVAAMVGSGWKDGECIVALRVDRDRAGRVADQIAAIQKALRVMERELRNTAAQHLVAAE